jgi:hypothetical protein
MMRRKNEIRARSEAENGTSKEYSVTPDGVLEERIAEQEYYGLCTTCNYAGECVGATNSTNPVIYCEEFDNTVEQKADAAPTLPKPENHMTKAMDLAANAVKGLCVNCEHRDTCQFPVPESGIWYCEEYL